MSKQKPTGLSRRKFLRAVVVMSPGLILTACGLPAASAPSTRTTESTTARPTSAPAPTQAAVTEPPTAQVAPTQAPATTAPTEPVPTETPLTEPTPTLAPQAQTLPPTPACGDDDEPTPAQTEGPYYTPNTPERASLLEPGMPGTKLIVTGYVLTTDCKPIPRALLDFWQADDRGQYDNAGYRLRGHQFTDDAGRYRLETIVPGLYTGRTRHIHVKVQAPNNPILTSQLYFPNEPGNARDGILNPKLIMDVQDQPDGSKLATFNFVLNVQ